MSYLTVEDTFRFIPQTLPGNLIEFGVYNGNTMNRLIKGAESYGTSFDKVYGFDSFVGLPKETEGVWQNPEWPEGAFSLYENYKLNSIEEGIEIVKSNVSHPDLVLVPGFFETSLTEEYGKELVNSGSYLHIDVDLHKSTVQVLEFLFKYRIPKLNSIIRYDDWCSTPEYGGGNSLAHKDICEKYNVHAFRIATNLFQIRNY